MTAAAIAVAIPTSRRSGFGFRLSAGSRGGPSTSVPTWYANPQNSTINAARNTAVAVGCDPENPALRMMISLKNRPKGASR